MSADVLRVPPFSERERMAAALATYSAHTGWQPTERDAQVFRAGVHMGVVAATKGGAA